MSEVDRFSKPTFVAMQPEHICSQALITLYVAFLGMGPFTSDPAHIAVAVLLLLMVIAVLWIYVMKEPRGATVTAINATVLMFCSAALLASPYFVARKMARSQTTTSVSGEQIAVWGETTEVPFSGPESKEQFPEGPLAVVTMLTAFYSYYLQLPFPVALPVATVSTLYAFVHIASLSAESMCVALSWPVLVIAKYAVVRVEMKAQQRRFGGSDIDAPPTAVVAKGSRGTPRKPKHDSTSEELQATPRQPGTTSDRSKSPGKQMPKKAKSTNASRGGENGGSVPLHTALSVNRSGTTLSDSLLEAAYHSQPDHPWVYASGHNPVIVPFLVLDRHAVVKQCSPAFGITSSIDPAFIEGRSLESFLEWIGSDGVDEIVSILEMQCKRAGTLARQQFRQPTPEESMPRRLLIRAAGFDDGSHGASFSPKDGFVKSYSSGESTAKSCSKPAPPAGQFALVVECWLRGPNEIAIQQPVPHALLNSLPVPLCLLLPDGTIVVWNSALSGMTDLTPYEMVGQNAFAELFGTPEHPMMKPLAYPFYGEITVGGDSSKAGKVFGTTLVEWPNCDRPLGHPPQSGNRIILCYVDRGRGRQQHNRGSHLLAALGRLVQDFNASSDGGKQELQETNSGVLSPGGPGKRRGSAVSIIDNQDGGNSSNLPSSPIDNVQGPLSPENSSSKRMAVFVEAVLSLVGQMAAIGAQEEEEKSPFVSDDYDNSSFAHSPPQKQIVGRQPSNGRSVTPGRSSGPSAGRGNSPASGQRGRPAQPMRGGGPRPASAGAPLANNAQNDGSPPRAWAKLQSQDESVCPSCFITTGPGEEFRVGRSNNCTLQMEDPFVSSVQFAVTRRVASGSKEPVVQLLDQSANGTYVNVRVVGRGKVAQLKPGDLINFRLHNSRFFLGFVFQLLSKNQSRSAEGRPTASPLSPSSALSRGHADPRIGMRSGRNGPVVSRGPPKEIRWKIGEEMLGKGGNAEVYLGMNLTNGKLMAVKRVALPQDARSQRQYQSLQDEINLLSVAKHTNIVQYYGSSQNQTHLHILLEFVPGGSIRHLLDNFGPLGDSIILRYLRQALHGLAYLHSMNIVHSDVKSANILVTDKGEVKLTDFGTAKLMGHAADTDAGKDKVTIVGTLLWMAPELVRGNAKPSAASDVWSLGCTLVEMLSGECPWNEYDFESEEEIINLLKYTNEPPEIPPTTNSLVHAIAFECLKLDPAQRPSCAKLLEMVTSHFAEQRRRRESMPREGSGTNMAAFSPANQAHGSPQARRSPEVDIPLAASGLGANRRSVTPPVMGRRGSIADSSAPPNLLAEVAKARSSLAQ